MNQKGISPLIATVLLIGFTVALVLVVTTWGSDYLKGILSSTEKSTSLALKCTPPYLDFEVTQVSCDSNSIVISNRGTEDIIKFKVIPYMSDGVKESREIIGPLVSGNVKGFGDIISSDVTKLEIIAYILLNNEEIPCARSVREVAVDCAVQA